MLTEFLLYRDDQPPSITFFLLAMTSAIPPSLLQLITGLCSSILLSLSLSCTHSSQQTLSRNWSATQHAIPLACSTLNLPHALRLHNLHYTSINAKEGVFWAEGWNSAQQRLLFHTHSRNLQVSVNRHSSTQALTPNQRVVGIYKNPDSSKLLLFKTTENLADDATPLNLNSQPPHHAFHLSITDLISNREQVRHQLNDFVYASDLKLTALQDDTWLLSGYVDHLIWTTIQVNSTATPQINQLPAFFKVSAITPHGILISHLTNSTPPQLLIYSNLSQPSLSETTASPPPAPPSEPPAAIPGFNLNTITLDHLSKPTEYAITIKDSSTLLVAFITPTDAKSTPPKPTLQLGTIDLATQNLNITATTKLQPYVTHEHLQFNYFNTRWHLLHNSTLGDQKLLYWYTLNHQHQLITTTHSTANQSAHQPTTQHRRWWQRWFGPPSAAPLKIFGPLISGGKLIDTIEHQTKLALLFKHVDQIQNRRYSVCSLTP